MTAPLDGFLVIDMAQCLSGSPAEPRLADLGAHSDAIIRELSLDD